MSVKLLTEHHLEFLSLKGDCAGSSESTLVKIPHCWKSHVMAPLCFVISGKYQEDIKRDYLLSEACTEKLVMAVSVVEGRCTALRSGGITVSKLYELQNCEDKLVPIVTLMKNGDFTGEVVAKLIKIRCKEVEMVKQKASLLTKLTSICHLLRKGNTCFTLHAGYFILLLLSADFKIYIS